VRNYGTGRPSTFNGNGTGDRSRIEVLWSNRPFPRQGSLFDLDDEVTA
jgi:hypothetical protein